MTKNTDTVLVKGMGRDDTVDMGLGVRKMGRDEVLRIRGEWGRRSDEVCGRRGEG